MMKDDDRLAQKKELDIITPSVYILLIVGPFIILFVACLITKTFKTSDFGLTIILAVSLETIWLFWRRWILGKNTIWMSVSMTLISLVAIFASAFASGAVGGSTSPNLIPDKLQNSTIVYILYLYQFIGKKPGTAIIFFIISWFISVIIYVISNASKKRNFNWKVFVAETIAMAIVITLTLLLPIDAWPILGLVGYIAFNDDKLRKILQRL